MMGIPIDGPSWMFGDNQGVITSSTIPHSNLNKRHNALSYHRVRSSIAAGIIFFIHIEGTINPSDILTKFLSWTKFWPLVQPFLFWKGETQKSTSPTLPITELVAELKHKPPSGLRGVSSMNQVSPSGTANATFLPSPSPDDSSPWEPETLCVSSPELNSSPSWEIQEAQVISGISTVPSTLCTGISNICDPHHNHLETYQESWMPSNLVPGTASTASSAPRHNHCLSEVNKTSDIYTYQEAVESYTELPWTVVMSKKSTH
jgi:hypothetical protein